MKKRKSIWRERAKRKHRPLNNRSHTMLKYFAPTLLLIYFLAPAFVGAAPPAVAVKFVILQPSDSTVGTPVTVTVEARKQNNQVDTSYQNDVTLVASGSATGGGLVDIVNGVGTREINDSVAETVTLSLSDTQSTGLDVGSTREVTFSSPGGVVWRQTNFWFRDDDGDELGATGWGKGNFRQDENVVISTPHIFQSEFRLRVALQAQQAAGTIIPRLEFRQGTGVDCLGSGWTNINKYSSGFILRNSPDVLNRASTTQQITGGSNFVSGLFLDEENPGPAVTFAKNEKTEYEWSLADTGSFARDVTYNFRITDKGTTLNSYSVCPTIIFPPIPQGIGAAPTVVSFLGQAFPKAKILIVDKDIKREMPLRQDIVTSGDGKFRIDFVGVLQSQHSFGLVIKDKENRTSQSKFFNVDAVTNSLTIKDILVPPTLDFINYSVTRGSNSIIVGSASLGHSVQIEIDGKIKKEASVEKDGSYKLTLKTGDLDFGPHKVRVKQTDPLEKKESDFSPTKILVVSRLSLPKSDLSGDGRVDIKDWSMFLSQWSSKDMEKKKVIDFNGDGKIDISDFSIFVKTIRRK